MYVRVGDLSAGTPWILRCVLACLVWKKWDQLLQCSTKCCSAKTVHYGRSTESMSKQGEAAATYNHLNIYCQLSTSGNIIWKFTRIYQSAIPWRNVFSFSTKLYEIIKKRFMLMWFELAIGAYFFLSLLMMLHWSGSIKCLKINYRHLAVRASSKTSGPLPWVYLRNFLLCLASFMTAYNVANFICSLLCGKMLRKKNKKKNSFLQIKSGQVLFHTLTRIAE